MTCSEENVKKTPNHVAIIMDGNGRWAKSKGKSRIFGHQAGTNNIRNIIEVFASLNLQSFSINKIWDKLIHQKELYGNITNIDFFHISTIDIYNSLLKKNFKY